MFIVLFYYVLILLVRMIVLFLFTSVSTLNLSEFDNIKISHDPAPALLVTKFQNVLIDFEPNIGGEYLIFQGTHDYAYLYSLKTQNVLWIVQNGSYEVYTAPCHANKLLFGWPNYTINETPMQLALYEGSPVVRPLKFNSEVFKGRVRGMTVGNMTSSEFENRTLLEIENVYKCPPPEEWKLYVLLTIIVALILSLLGVKHELIQAIFGPKISRVIQRIRALLSGSFEVGSTDNSETDSDVPEKPRRLHVTQTYT